MRDADTLTYEDLLSDPLIRLVMQSDGVTVSQVVTILRAASAATRRHPLSLGHAAWPGVTGPRLVAND